MTRPHTRPAAAAPIRIALFAPAVLCALACAGLAPTEHALDATDHAVLVEAAEVNAFLVEPWTIDPAGETWSKQKQFGTWDVEYAYEAEGVFVTTVISVESSVSDAETAMWAMDLVAGAMFGDGVTATPDDTLFTGGDARSCKLITQSATGNAVGDFCVIRVGSAVGMYAIVGAVFEGPGGLDPVLGGPVAALAGYVPAEAPLP